MPGLIKILRVRRNLLLASGAWILLWIVPWGQLPAAQSVSAVAVAVDLLRLAAALGMFLLPGMLLYWLLRDRNGELKEATGIIPIGFALSVFLIGAIGLIGRALGLSFAAVEAVFAVSGLIELVLLMWLEPEFGVPHGSISGAVREVLLNLPLMVALLVSIAVIINPGLFFIDDTTYAAYARNWQLSSRLGFENLIYGVPVTESVRFWLALYPMGQALMSQISGLPVLILFSNYLELFLVPIAIIALFWELRELGLSVRASGLAVLVQVALYTWMQGDQWPPGFWFFQNMTNDKVTAAYVLAPVFFIFVIRYLARPRMTGFLLMLAAAFGLTLTHPVPLFYACVIASGAALIARVLKSTTWRATLVTWGTCVLSLVPYLLIRISPSMAPLHMTFDSESTSFEISKYTHAISDVFYGLNPAVLEFLDIPATSPAHASYQFFRLLPAAILALGGILALLALRRGPVYWHTAMSALLVGAATFPYTGWLLGYFVSARMLVRISWFAPFGVAAVILLQELLGRANHGSLPRQLAAAPRSMFLAVGTTIIVALGLGYAIVPRAAQYLQVLDHYKQLAAVGSYIDRSTAQQVTVTALDYVDIQLMPGASARAKLISFREEVDDNGMNSFMSLDEIRQRKYASNAIISLDRGVSGPERCSLIAQYAVRYVVADRKLVDQFEQSLGSCSDRIRVVYGTHDLALLEIR